MKMSTISTLLSFWVVVVGGLEVNVSFATNLQWTPDSGIRIFGTYNAAIPRVVRKLSSGGWGMYYYEGDSWTYGDTGYATSNDGLTWNRVGRVMTHGGHDFDNVNAVITDIVSLADGSLRAYCEGLNTTGSGARSNIFIADSSDGINWKNRRQVFIPQNGTLYSGAYGVSFPRVFHAENEYIMYFVGNDNTISRIFRTISSNGINNWSFPQMVIEPPSGGSLGSFYIVNYPTEGLIRIFITTRFVGDSGNCVRSLASLDNGNKWSWENGVRLAPSQYSVEDLQCPVLSEIAGSSKMYIGGGHGGSGGGHWDVLSASSESDSQDWQTTVKFCRDDANTNAEICKAFSILYQKYAYSSQSVTGNLIQATIKLSKNLINDLLDIEFSDGLVDIVKETKVTVEDISNFGDTLGNSPISVGDVLNGGYASQAGLSFEDAEKDFESERDEWQKVLDNPKNMDQQRLLQLLDSEVEHLTGDYDARKYINNFSTNNNTNLQLFVKKSLDAIAQMTEYIKTLQCDLRGECKMRITTFCPVDLVITSPSGAVLSKTQNQILGATYNELDINGDLRMDDIAEIPVPILGKYAITVVPEDGASPTDIYTLAVEKSGIPTVLAEDIQIQNIPESNYITEGSVNISLAINKCKVTAGKIQGQDVFEASGTFDSFSADINDVNQINIYIASLADAAIIYTETIDLNASSDVVKGKYSYKIPKGRKAGIASLIINFNKKTFAIKSKNINLTGLGCPLQLSIVMGNYILSGQVPESIVNGSKSIPTRLMRTYKNTLFVSKAKVRNSSKPSSDSLSVKGEIAVADINNSNLAIQDVKVVWGDHTFAIPAHSFKAVRRGNSYKCSGIATDGSDSLITANIDLDKCTFAILVKNADSLNVGPNEVVFGLRFVDFNESDEVNPALGY